MPTFHFWLLKDTVNTETLMKTTKEYRYCNKKKKKRKNGGNKISLHLKKNFFELNLDIPLKSH